MGRRLLWLVLAVMLLLACPLAASAQPLAMMTLMMNPVGTPVAFDPGYGALNLTLYSDEGWYLGAQGIWYFGENAGVKGRTKHRSDRLLPQRDRLRQAGTIRR